MNTLRLLILGLALGYALTMVGCATQDRRIPASSMAIEEVNEADYWALIPRQREPGLPVLYFLHGRGNSQHMFKALGGVEKYLEHVESSGKPFAIVAFRDGNKERNFYWTDEAGDGGVQWATHIVRELLPAIESKYGIGGARARRMIAGISMGSAGAFQIGMNFPETFRCAAGHSIVVRDAKSAVADFPTAFKDEATYKAKFDPIELVKKHRARGNRIFDKVWIDIGGKDSPGWVERARELEAELLSAGYSADRLDVAVRYPEGKHDSVYWSSRIPEYLNWYDDCLFGTE